jgi:Heparinase II/III-like protein
MSLRGHAITLAILVGNWLPMQTNALGAQLIPAASAIKKDHPRLLIRPKATPHAISLEQLKSIPRDAEFKRMLAQLRKCGGAAPHALAWLLTGKKADAEKALARMKSWKTPDSKSLNNAFRIYFGCRDMALAYDWLYNYPGFSKEIKAEVRAKVLPLAQAGARGDDHIFHNYVWMWNSGAMLWALATAGEDPESDKILKAVGRRFNTKYFPAMKHLAGQPADSQGYWALYCLAPGTMVLLSAQSACEQPLVAQVKADGDWLRGQLQNIVHAALPDMRYLPWGDMQSGPDGAVSHEMACNIDMLTWATKSSTGAYLSKWLTGKRGDKRFYGETAMFYFLYTRNLSSKPAAPPLSHLSGGKHGGHFIARDKWQDGATILGFRCNDAYTGHNHMDQGSFVIYRKGLLALDAGYYKKAGGSQRQTRNHNTLLFGGKGQRYVRPRSNASLESYLRGLKPGKRSFETGNILFHKEAKAWTAVAGEFGQAYDPAVVGKVVRQVLFLRPRTVAVVDHLTAPAGKNLPEVSWLLHLPSEPQINAGTLVTDNGKAWLRCRALLPAKVKPKVKGGATTLIAPKKKQPTWCATYKYPGKASMVLLHLIEVGDGTTPARQVRAAVKSVAEGLELKLGSSTYLFASRAPYSVSAK